MRARLARNPAVKLPSLSERLELFYRATGTSPHELDPDDWQGEDD